MTLNELIKNAQVWVDKGYGEKQIIVENGDFNLEIDSIQSDTNSGVEPNYLFVMPGGIANIEIREEFK